MSDSPSRSITPAAFPPPLVRRTRSVLLRFVGDRALPAAQGFLQTETAGGVLLLVAAVVALIWVNSPLESSYTDLWHTVITVDLAVVRIEQDLRHLVNEGLMTIFFFVVGLEIKRELVHGELSDGNRAFLPVAAALGGMAFPALMYTAINWGGEGSRGWGIPMATDIAFAVGVMSLAGNRVPFGAKIFLLALAIVDDLGAILVIGLFYAEDVAVLPLVLAALTFSVMAGLNRMRVRALFLYALLGAVLWVLMLESGVHATLAGVAMGLLAPSRPDNDPERFDETMTDLSGRFLQARAASDRAGQEEALAKIESLAEGSEAPLERFERSLHPWVSFGIMPVFALANAGVHLSGPLLSDAASSSVTLGVAAGLIVGKFAGVTFFTWLCIRSGVTALPSGMTWPSVLGMAALAGIGFTVSLFMTDLAFEASEFSAQAKIGILVASVLSGIFGYLLLRHSPRLEQVA